MADFTTKPKGLFDLLEDIDEGKIQLPQFQRDFKWGQNKVKKLLNSIQAGYPAGSLLFLEIDPNDSKLSYRPFYFSDASKKLDEPKFLVLDGQQRLTSCYYAFYNNAATCESKEKSFYLDYGNLFKSYGKTDFAFEDFIIIKDRDSVAAKTLREKGWLNLTNLKTQKDYYNAVNDINKNKPDETLNNFLLTVLPDYLDKLFKYEFPVVELDKNLSLDAVCKIFETINTTGLKLSSFDICVAKFMRQGINLREMMEEVKKNDVLKNIFDQDENLLLQAIALLARKSPKANALPDNLDVDDIKEWWLKAVQGFEFTVEELDKIGVGISKNTQLLPYAPVLPLFSALAVRTNIMNEPKSNTLVIGRYEDKIRQYFYTTACAFYYTEGTDAKIGGNYNELFEWINDDTKKPPVIVTGVQWNTEKMLYYTKDSAFGKAVLCLINSESPEDFYTTSTVGNGTDKAESQLHHIFPKAQYRDEYDEKKLNSIFNFTFITSESNNHIKDNKTCDYIQEITTKIKTESNLKELLTKHFLDKDCYKYLKNEDFENFVTTRAELIKEKLINRCGVVINTVQDDVFEYHDEE